VKTPPRNSGFTLIELLMVIAIIGIIALIAGPSIVNLRATDALAASTRQLLDDVARARQHAISQRTTVYMVFCPSNFWSDPNYANLYSQLPQSERDKFPKLYDKQLNGYTFVTLRSIGDQPGQISPRYLSSWKTLPEGAIIAPFKFSHRTLPPTTIYDPPQPATPTKRTFDVYGFARTNTIPFPSAGAYAPGRVYIQLPYIAFNHMGQIEPPMGTGRADGLPELIPVARGNVAHVKDANKVPTQDVPTVHENPPGNSTNAWLLVLIDRLTGRARLEKQELP
jgi:prepilin-type N-terminal cleavage/methylation domain-containing protein